MTRQLVLAVAFAVVVPSAAQARTNTERLQELIQTSSASRDPNIGFIVGFYDWPDFEMDPFEIRNALALSGLPPGGPLYELLLDAVEISKSRGRRVKIKSTREHVFAMDGGGSVKFKKEIQFELTRGSIEDIRDNGRRNRLRDASPGPYTWLNEVKNIQVSEGGEFYNLYDLYYVREHSGTVVAWIKAGKFGFGLASRWVRMAFEDDEEIAAAHPSTAGGAVSALGGVADGVQPKVEREAPEVEREAPEEPEEAEDAPAQEPSPPAQRIVQINRPLGE